MFKGVSLLNKRVAWVCIMSQEIWTAVLF